MTKRTILLTLLALLIAPVLYAERVVGYIDLAVYSTAPGNPSPQYFRLYMTGNGLGCVTSAGANCLPSGSVAFPATTADIATPINAPPAGSTTWYTKAGKLCNLDSTGSEYCMGGIVVPLVLTPSLQTSYSNPLSTGDRTGQIAVSGSSDIVSNFGSGAGVLVSGAAAQFALGNGWYGPGAYLQFDFGSPYLITEFKLYASTQGTCAVGDCLFKWQGSNDAFNWTDLSGSVAWNGTTVWPAAANTAQFRYYRMQQTGVRSAQTGNGFGSMVLRADFKVSTAPYLTTVFSTSGRMASTGTVDSTAAIHTMPVRVGTTAAKPSTCTIGELYFASDAAAGQNLYLCSALNTWSAPGAASAGAINMPATSLDQGSTPSAPTAGSTKWYTKGGRLCSVDSTSTEACTGGVVVPMNLTPVAASSPYNSGDRRSNITVTTNGWFWANVASCSSCDQALVDGSYGNPGDSLGTASNGGTITFDFKAAHLVTGSKIYVSGGNYPNFMTVQWLGSNDNSNWTTIGAQFVVPSPSNPYDDPSMANNVVSYRYYQVHIVGNTTLQPVITEIEFVTDSAPYASVTINNGGKEINSGGAVDHSAAVHTLPMRVGPVAFLPSVCTVGEFYFASDVAAGWNQYTCTAANTWTPPSFGNALPLTLTAPNNSPYNAGNRQASITVSTSAWFWANTSSCAGCDHAMVDGNRTAVPDNFGGGGTMLFDFGGGHTVTAAVIWSGSCSGNLLTNAKWSGSNDNSTWTDFATFSVPCSSSVNGYADTTLAANATAYRYYRLTTGSVNGSTSMTETEFTVDYSPQTYTVETAKGKQINNGGAVDYSAAVHTMPARVGPIAGLPTACTQGELYFATDAATPGKNLYFCTATNTWTATP